MPQSPEREGIRPNQQLTTFRPEYARRRTLRPDILLHRKMQTRPRHDHQEDSSPWQTSQCKTRRTRRLSTSRTSQTLYQNIFRAPSSSYSRTDYKCPRASRLRRAAVDICNRFCATRPCGTACSGHDKPPDGGAEKGLFRSARRRAHRTDGCGQAFCEMARLSRDQSGLRRLTLIEPYVQFSRIRLSVWDT